MKQKYKYTVREVLIAYMDDNITDGESSDMLQEKVEVKWCPKLKKQYYYVDRWGNTTNNTFYNDNVDSWRIQTGNCFPYTEEGKKLSEEYKQKLISLGEK